MPLYIKDDEVDALATELQSITGAPSKTEAVRTALKDAIGKRRKQAPLIARIKEIQDQVAAMGPRDPDFDMKKFTDEMWGDV